MNIYTATTKGYALDQSGRKHFSIHPRVYEGGRSGSKFADHMAGSMKR